ncbi:MAG TPA: hypothetical protein VLS93_05445 [Anaeromyxobacteraceae bacterium]|nr:hypothetical protein [Anaeromyxobacteraceae bacterium]
MSRLSRFLHLERPRAADGARGADAETSPSTAGRFGGVERPDPRAGPQAPRTSGAGLDRFGPEPPPRIELLDTSAGDRPFTRCMRCGMDHNVFATGCSGCGASLDTAEQRAFNERLWAERQAEARREAAAAAERRAGEARDQAELAAARRAMGEELAREVAGRERSRLGAGAPWGDPSSGWLGPPLFLRLLRALPDWRWQLGAIFATLALLGGLAAAGFAGHPFALLVAVLLGILLVVPRWRVDRF